MEQDFGAGFWIRFGGDDAFGTVGMAAVDEFGARWGFDSEASGFAWREHRPS